MIRDLHLPSTSTPSVPSRNGSNPELERVLERRSALNEVLAVHYSTLASNSNSTMSTPLVDPQGFPRSDIDVAAVRTARVQIIRLSNDLKQVELDLGRLVQHALSSTEAAARTEPSTREPLLPFAKVNSVAADSPAQTAGLEADDMIISISSIDCTNHENLTRVGQLVTASEGKPLPVVIERTRDQKRHVLRLVPQSGWGGRGLLGCHIVPYP
ncbi:Nas2p [Sporobolomyces koalae]|uniref:Nas2p n=1 Tax=Sporobolomyces koalae TaxID=500713 RepID=UPI003170B029